MSKKCCFLERLFGLHLVAKQLQWWPNRGINLPLPLTFDGGPWSSLIS